MQALDAYVANPASCPDAETLKLLGPGSDLGGARPKTLIMHEGTEHIAKFSRPDDSFDVPAVEYASLRLATKARLTIERMARS